MQLLLLFLLLCSMLVCSTELASTFDDGLGHTLTSLQALAQNKTWLPIPAELVRNPYTDAFPDGSFACLIGLSSGKSDTWNAT